MLNSLLKTFCAVLTRRVDCFRIKYSKKTENDHRNQKKSKSVLTKTKKLAILYLVKRNEVAQAPLNQNCASGETTRIKTRFGYSLKKRT